MDVGDFPTPWGLPLQVKSQKVEIPGLPYGRVWRHDLGSIQRLIWKEQLEAVEAACWQRPVLADKWHSGGWTWRWQFPQVPASGVEGSSSVQFHGVVFGFVTRSLASSSSYSATILPPAHRGHFPLIAVRNLLRPSRPPSHSLWVWSLVLS